MLKQICNLSEYGILAVNFGPYHLCSRLICVIICRIKLIEIGSYMLMYMKAYVLGHIRLEINHEYLKSRTLLRRVYSSLSSGICQM